MKTLTLVIVEDQAIVANYIKAILENVGYKVIGTFATAEDALLFLQNNKTDLVLMDIMLEGKLTGIDAANILIKTNDLPIIFLTALSDPATLELAKRTSPYAYIVKPFEENDLVHRVAFAIQKHKSDAKVTRTRLQAIFEGQEIEKRRISKELHDGLGQLLNRIMFEIETLTPAQDLLPKKQILSKLCKKAIEDMRGVITELMPMHVIDFDIVTSLKELSAQYQSDLLEVQFYTNEEKIQVKENIRFTIYRICQEILNNVGKHSKASKLTVQINKEETWLSVTIEDNGVGFHTDTLKPGNGLRNIKERAISIQAELTIHSELEKGTLIHFQLLL